MALDPVLISDRIEAVLVANMSQTDGAVARRDLSDQVADEIVLAAETAAGETVLEYVNLAAFPGTGELNRVYIAADTNKIYRWTGSAYAELAPSPAAPGTTNGVTTISGAYGLGGSLTQTTGIELASNPLNFTQAAAAVLSLTAAGRIGIATASPATRVNTATATTNQTDGTYSTAANGFGYEVSQVGYAAVFANTTSVTTGAGGMLVKIARTNADTFALNVVAGSTSVFQAIANGRVVAGPYGSSQAANQNLTRLKGNLKIQAASYLSNEINVGASADGNLAMLTGADFSTTSNQYNSSTSSDNKSGIIFGSSSVNPFRLVMSPSVTNGSAITWRNILRAYTSAGVDYLSFLGAAPVAKQTLSGSWGGNAAGKNLATILANLGLINDSSTL